MFYDIVQHPGMNAHVPVYNQHNIQEIPDDNNTKKITSVISSNYPANISPVIIRNEQPQQNIDIHEDIEESLSIMDKEKELIIKALKKHRGKRKDAALDLGISERTLYRKLKEYDIEHL